MTEDENRGIKFEPYSTHLNKFSGGMSYGLPREGYGVVVLSEEGDEFACKFFQDGSLWAGFPGYGLACSYSFDEKLEFITIDVERFLKGMKEDERLSMTNGGQDMQRMMDLLKEKKNSVFITIMAESGLVDVMVVNEKRELLLNETRESPDPNMRAKGELSIEGIVLNYYYGKNNDEFTVGMGETSDGDDVFGTLAVSGEVPYQDLLDTKNVNRYRVLAKKIVLN